MKNFVLYYGFEGFDKDGGHPNMYAKIGETQCLFTGCSWEV